MAPLMAAAGGVAAGAAIGGLISGGKSSSRTSITNDISNYLSETQRNDIQNSCSTGQKGTNVINVHGAKNCKFENIKQQNDLVDNCMFYNSLQQMNKTDQESLAKDDVYSKAAQAGLFNSSKSSTDIRNTLTSQTDIQKLNNIIQSCASKQDATNILNVSGCNNSQFVGINQLNNQVNKCIHSTALKQFSDNKNLAKAIAKADTTSTASGSKKAGLGGGPPGSGGGNSRMIIGVIAICIIFAICCCCLMLLGGGSMMMLGSSGSSGSNHSGNPGAE